MGFYLENLVGARFIEAVWETYYWKDKNHEVDFIVLGRGGEKFAVEVKAAPPSMSELKSLIKFCRAQTEFTPVVICPDEIKLPAIHWLSAEKAVALSLSKPFSVANAANTCTRFELAHNKGVVSGL
jgi:predicted AAA+ superfamily ATPase